MFDEVMSVADLAGSLERMTSVIYSMVHELSLGVYPSSNHYLP